MSQGWARVAGQLLNSSRPFYVYSWKQALMVDLKIALRMIGIPLSIGVILACLPFNTDVETKDHPLYAFVGIGILGFQTGACIFWPLASSCVSRPLCECLDWILFLHPYEHHELPLQCNRCPFHQHCPLFRPVGHRLSILQHPCLHHAYPHNLRPTIPARVLDHEAHVCIGLLDVLSTYACTSETEVRGQEGCRELADHPRVLYAGLCGQSIAGAEFWTEGHDIAHCSECDLSAAREQKQNRLRQNGRSIQPQICCRRGSLLHIRVLRFPGLTRQQRPYWHAPSLQMIVFLSINSKANPLYIFFLINFTDFICLIVGGPVSAFFEKNNAQILKEHREKVDTDPFNEALGVFAKWVKVGPPHHPSLPSSWSSRCSMLRTHFI